MNKNLILLISVFVVEIQTVNPQSKTESLPVMDLLKNYPLKNINIQDIADLEYIALETTNDILLSDNAVLSYVSDNYILIHEPQRGDIFVFSRAGKIISHFNHRGPGPGEYPSIRNVDGATGTIFDEKNKEIFVCFGSIQVYSLGGEHKRTLPVNTILNNARVFNFDDEALLVYEDYVMDLDRPNNPKTNPYSLVSKKDGKLISILDIHFPKRNSTKKTQTVGPGQVRSTQNFLSTNMCYGKNFIITDVSSDTLYLLTQNRILTPLLTRKPSAHASEPRLGWLTGLITDKFIQISRFPLEGSARVPLFTYEFETGEISVWSFYDPDADLGYRGSYFWRELPSYPATNKNMYAELVWPSFIIDAYKAKRLKGNIEIEKFAKTLDEDDNPVVRIIKFK